MNTLSTPKELLHSIHARDGLKGPVLLQAYRRLTKISAIDLPPGCDDRDDPAVLLASLTAEERETFGLGVALPPPVDLKPAPEPGPGGAPIPVYKVRVHAILCANSDGSGGAASVHAVDTAHIQQVIAAANNVYQAAGLELLFDPTTDFERVDSSLLNLDFTPPDGLDLAAPKDQPPLSNAQIQQLAEPHARARNEIGGNHCNKLVLLYCDGNMLVYDDVAGCWVFSERNFAFSGSDLHYVALPTRRGDVKADADLLAHESGHYFHLGHPHSHYPETVAEAALLIRDNVEKGSFSREDGLEVFDGDGLDDTPPDAGEKIFDSEYGNNGCGPDGTIVIPVTFSDGTSKEYVLAPDRSNVMSYFKHCVAFAFHFSPMQIEIIRRSIRAENRNHLINPIRCVANWPGWIIPRLAWIWVILLGGLMLWPGGIECIVCGPIGTRILGVVSILIGVAGWLSDRDYRRPPGTGLV